MDGKADGAAVCLTVGLDPDCDLCESYNWYADGECDQPFVDWGYCKKHDPDCGALRAEGAHFRDRDGAAVILRGYGMSAGAKVPPFRSLSDESQLDPLVDLGTNVIRLLFTWEAYEPAQGHYDEDYLDSVVATIRAAHDRGIYTILDNHQDGFSRYLSGGCGDGFPEWAVTPWAPRAIPHNSIACAAWQIAMAFDWGVHMSFSDFYSDAHGTRKAFLAMLKRVAARLGHEPGLIGYDLLNEPWGDERTELAPLYEDATAAIRSVHPSAIIFVEGHARTNGGYLQTDLPRPRFDNVAYAPHFYDPTVFASKIYTGVTHPIHGGFRMMRDKAAEWNVPLFVGEFGTDAITLGAEAYIDEHYAQLDTYLASGAQWNYTPNWTPQTHDGWNAEDMSVIAEGKRRKTCRPRATPRRIAGDPIAFSVSDQVVRLQWRHRPAMGATTIFLPPGVYDNYRIDTSGADLTCTRTAREVQCHSPRPGIARVDIRPCKDSECK